MDAPGNPYATLAQSARAPTDPASLPDVQGNPYVTLQKAVTPSQNMTNTEALSELQKSGALEDPGLRAFVAQHGAKMGWDAIHNRGGYTPENVAEQGWQQNYQKQAPGMGFLESVGHGMLDSGLGALRLATSLESHLPLIGGLAQRGLQKVNRIQQAYDNNMQPVTNAVAQVAPLSQFGGNWLGQTAVQIPTFMTGLDEGSLGTRIALGALQGAAGGALMPSTAQHPYAPAVAGAVLGGALPVAGKALSFLPKVPFIGGIARDMGNAAGMATDLGRRAEAGNVLTQLTDGSVPEADPAQYVPGFKPTLSGVTQSPRVGALENALAGRNAAGVPEDPILMRRFANQAAMKGARENLQNGLSADAASEAVQGRMQINHDMEKAVKNEQFGNALTRAGNPWVSFKPVQSAIEGTLSNLSPTQVAEIPRAVQALRGYNGTTMPVRDLLSDYLTLGDIAQGAREQGNHVQAKIAQDVASSIKGQLLQPDLRDASGKFLPPSTGQQFVQDMNNAFTDARKFHSTFTANPKIAGALRPMPTVAARINPSDALDRIIGSGTPEDAAALAKTLKADPQAHSAVMSWLADGLDKHAQGPLTEKNAGTVARYFYKMAPVIKEFSTPQQQQLLDQYLRSAGANDFADSIRGAYSNSATQPMLNAGNSLFARLATKAPGPSSAEEAGMLAGLGGGAHGVIAGNIVGRAVDQAWRGLVGKGVNRTLDLVQHGLVDPETARILMRDASDWNSKTLGERLVAHIKNPIARGAVNAARKGLTNPVAQGMVRNQALRFVPGAHIPSLPGSPFGG